MRTIFNLLRGIDIPPAAVGLARGAVEAAVMAGIVEVLVLFGETEWGDAIWAPLVIYAMRQLESIADHIDPAKKRAP